eukprot:scaffold256_cov57-Attheya_sp.AAC.1
MALLSSAQTVSGTVRYETGGGDHGSILLWVWGAIYLAVFEKISDPSSAPTRTKILTLMGEGAHLVLRHNLPIQFHLNNHSSQTSMGIKQWHLAVAATAAADFEISTSILNSVCASDAHLCCPQSGVITFCFRHVRASLVLTGVFLGVILFI